jgi:hypothetical protein
VIHAVSESDRRKESAVYRDIDDAPDAAGDAPVTPLWRTRPLTRTTVHVESGEEGPKRLTRHERVPEDGHERGR